MARKSETLSFTFTGEDGSATDLSFLITQLAPSKATKLGIRLGRAFGASIGELVGSLGGAGAAFSLATMDVGALGYAFQKLCAELDDKETDELLSALFESVTFKTSPLTKNLSDVLFAGQLREYYQLLGVVVRVNFKDFFPESGGSPAK